MTGTENQGGAELTVIVKIPSPLRTVTAGASQVQCTPGTVRDVIREVDGHYGGFAERVMDLRPGSWEGPLPSSHGLHLVWVHEQTPGAPLPLAAVRNEVRYALLAERGEQALRRAIEELRDRYQVRVAAP